MVAPATTSALDPYSAALTSTVPRMRRITILGAAALAASLLGAGAPATARSHHTLTTYPGYSGVIVHRHRHQLGRLKGTSASFKRFVRAELDRTWRTYGSRPACAHAPNLSVKRYRSDGWAYGATGMGAGDNPASCNFGGSYAVFHKAAGRWRTIFGGQDVPRCTRLRLLHIPADIGFGGCLSGSDHLVAYPRRHPRLTMAGFDGVGAGWSFTAASAFTWTFSDTSTCGLPYFRLARMTFTDFGRASGHRRGSRLVMWTANDKLAGPHGTHAGMSNARIGRLLGARARHRTIGRYGHEQTYLRGRRGTLWFVSADARPATRVAFMGIAPSVRMAGMVDEPLVGC